MEKIRDFLKGNKTYITAAIGILGAFAAWADGQIDVKALLAAIWAAGSIAFLRAGMNNATAKKDETK